MFLSVHWFIFRYFKQIWIDGEMPCQHLKLPLDTSCVLESRTGPQLLHMYTDCNHYPTIVNPCTQHGVLVILGNVYVVKITPWSFWCVSMPIKWLFIPGLYSHCIVTMQCLNVDWNAFILFQCVFIIYFLISHLLPLNIKHFNTTFTDFYMVILFIHLHQFLLHYLWSAVGPLWG